MGKSNIEWTDMVWNPVTGCTKVSPGCQNCYAERIFNRFNRDRVEGGVVIHNPKDGTPGIKRRFSDVVCHYDRLDQPLHWKKPRRIFVCSMGDLFHEDVPFEFTRSVFLKMRECHRHIFLVLTKRPERVLEFNEWSEFGEGNDCLYSAWQKWIYLGVTAENQEQADKRIPILLQIPAAKRFVSIEPMLGAVSLAKWLKYPCGASIGITHDCDESFRHSHKALDWVILGAESGAGRRFLDNRHVRDVVFQCRQANIPVFIKQLHDRQHLVFNEDRKGFKVVKNPAEWPEDLRLREYPG